TATGGEPSGSGGALPSGGTGDHSTGGLPVATGGASAETNLTSCPGRTIYLGGVPECTPQWCDSLHIGPHEDPFAWPCYVHDVNTEACEAPESMGGYCCCQPVPFATGGSVGTGGTLQ